MKLLYWRFPDIAWKNFSFEIVTDDGREIKITGSGDEITLEDVRGQTSKT